jgi:hypothetical protein
MKLIHALKEWAIAVDALEHGKIILLLRKGGIHEQGKTFTVTHNPILLYPTYEHQKTELLKPAYATQVQPVSSGWHPAMVRIGAWAQITNIFRVSEEPIVTALLPYHIWNHQFAQERFGWKPRQPLYVLLLRTYKLLQAKEIPYRAEYGGCKSWIDLAEPISLEKSLPVLSDIDYSKQVTEICDKIQVDCPV